MDWRLEVARRIEQHYDSPRVAVVAVAGSVGAGVADRWSDLELDCYWWEPPTDADRRGPIDRLGAELDGIWDYDRDDEEWSEDYRVDQLPVTISNFTVATVDALLAAVLDRADTDPVKHIRLAAIQRCRVLRGEALVSAWRQRAAEFPDDLVAALVAQTLSPDVLRGWSARDALVERGDTVAIHGLLAGIELAVFNAVLALNRIYRPHRIAKWQRHLASELRQVSRTNCHRRR